MLHHLPSENSTRPVVIDGEVVWLPTLAGLLNGQAPVQPSAGRASLSSAVVAAVVADRLIDETEAELALGIDVSAPEDLSTLDDLDAMVAEARRILGTEN